MQPTPSAPRRMGFLHHYASAFLIDTLAPDEYRERNYGRRSLMPEQRLAFALLEGAWNDLQLPHRMRRHRGQLVACDHCIAQDWISGADATYTLTFAAVCDALNIDPSYWRRVLLTSGTRRRQERATELAQGPLRGCATLRTYSP